MRQGWCPKCQKITIQNVVKFGYPIVYRIEVGCAECNSLLEWKDIQGRNNVKKD